jgi:ethanolamine ammonia-lyase large subunit
MRFRQTLRGRQFAFVELRELLAKASEEKSGDQLAGIAAESDQERVAAKWALADVTLAEIVQQPLIDPNQDDVTRLILESLDQAAFAAYQSWTVGQLREWLLSAGWQDETELRALQRGITPEIAAAVARLMSNRT